jgi:transposase-like protein
MKEPPFCPRLTCKLHKKEPETTTWYYKAGHYHTKAFSRVQRYRCKICGKYFSAQTFSLDYYAKKVVDYRELLKRLVSTSGTRDMARDFDISTGTVQNKLFRLSHQAMAVHEDLKAALKRPDDMVADGFESYSVSQYFPNNIHLLALRESQYVYFSNYVTIRRKGRMTRAQKARRKALEKRFWPAYKGIEFSFNDVLDEVARFKQNCGPASFRFITDEKKDYRRAMQEHKIMKRFLQDKQIEHVTVNSRKPRTARNPLFAVNYLDRQFRKDLSNHVRETVCFARNVNNCMERQMIYLMYHNYLKQFRENQRYQNRITHAEMAGIEKRLIQTTVSRAFTVRRFLSLANINGFVRRLWKRTLFTPLKQVVEFIPKYTLS